jgi:hypothetical protein
MHNDELVTLIRKLATDSNTGSHIARQVLEQLHASEKPHSPRISFARAVTEALDIPFPAVLRLGMLGWVGFDNTGFVTDEQLDELIQPWIDAYNAETPRDDAT